jgi:hypothetical protein
LLGGNSGGVILSEGGGDDSLWFAGSFGSGDGTFTTPAGDFSTLVENSGVAVDALGDVATYDISSNSLPTVTVDPLNRISTCTTMPAT